MSLFRKPKKIQRRVFCADDDEECDPEPPPPPVISEKKENKQVKITPLLSFVDEEEDDGEVFKVKKSSQSKRLAKRREKEKRKVTDGDIHKYDNNSNEENSNHIENRDVEVREKAKPKKKVTLEGLILSGREALAADGAGDVSDGSQPEEEEDSRGFHQYRPETVRAALAVAPGHIPDAALIHAARKTRQKARELGGEYIPIRSSEAKPGSRLVRDDGSGDEDDDEEEGRLHVRGLELPSDKPKRGTAAEPSNEELDSEVDEWEEQQIKKAMPAIVDITGETCVDLNPFAAPPPPPPLPPAEPVGLLRPLDSLAPLTTSGDLMDALTLRLEQLKTERAERRCEREELRLRLAAAAGRQQRRAARAAALDRAYRRAQAARGYITDLVECLDEKLPRLEALEARALLLHRRRCDFLTERRRADVRDQAHDVLAATHTGRGVGRGAGVVCEADGERVRRAAEREGRRRARRLRREAAAGGGAPHRDGDSSDDDLPPTEMMHYAAEIEALRSGRASLFGDTLRAYRDVRGVCGRLAKFRARAPTLYAEAYLPACLPRLLAPYVRHQLLLWNPLADEDNEDYEKMDWYKCLMMYGVSSSKLVAGSSGSSSDSDHSVLEEGEGEGEGASGDPPGRVTPRGVRDDPDLMLVPTIVAKVVLPKLTELVEQAWDPMCVRATVRLRRQLVGAAGVPGAGGALRALAAAAAARLAAARAHDVFLPPLPHHVVEGSGPGAVFWRRCLGAGVRLLRAALALTAPPPLLRADHIVLAIIETLCAGAGCAPGGLAAGACGALADSLPRAGPLRAAAARRLARLARLARDRLPPTPDMPPAHRKALEQIKSILAEVREE